MRIHKKILTQLEKYKNDIPGEYYVFGSRLDTTKKGGDIDILVVNKSHKSDLKLSLELESELFRLSEEKIDVVVFPQNMSDEQKLFFDSITKQRIGVA